MAAKRSYLTSEVINEVSIDNYSEVQELIECIALLVRKFFWQANITWTSV